MSVVAMLATSLLAFAPPARMGMVRVAAATHVRGLSAMSVSDSINSLIKENDVVVFSKSYCPFCGRTKSLFADVLKVDAKVLELDKMSDGDEYQSALLTMTGQKTVPNVFVKGQHVGGNDATQAANKDGKLKEMLGL